jgi:hypothetical protein
VGYFRERSEYNKENCKNIEHDPPKHISLPSGMYEHICPSCGRVTKITVAPTHLNVKG